MTSAPVIHLIDDDPAVRNALSFLIRTAGFDVEAYDSAVSFLAAGTHSPGCIITDIRMPELDGLALQHRLVEEDCKIPVIVMTAHADVTLAVEAMKAGAVDFIEKPFDYDVLLDAIRTALAHGSDNLLRDQRAEELRRRLKMLSAREHQVLEGLVAGKSNKIIAHDLSLSMRTVEGYRATVMAKMQTHSLSALIRMVLSSNGAGM